MIRKKSLLQQHREEILEAVLGDPDAEQQDALQALIESDAECKAYAASLVTLKQRLESEKIQANDSPALPDDFHASLRDRLQPDSSNAWELIWQLMNRKVAPPVICICLAIGLAMLFDPPLSIPPSGSLSGLQHQMHTNVPETFQSSRSQFRRYLTGHDIKLTTLLENRDDPKPLPKRHSTYSMMDARMASGLPDDLF